jgi:HEAT repeat protein
LFACAASISPGCAGDSAARDSSSEGARVVPLAELPETYRATWAAWLEGAPEFELERARVERDPDLARFVVDNLVREMVRTYDRSGFARPGGEPGRFERAQADLVAFAPQSAPVLAELVRVRDGVVAFLAADRLVAIGPPSVPLVLPLLAAERTETRRRAAELLGRLAHVGQGEIEVQKALADHAEHDPEWPVRAEAARSLGARGRRHDHKGYAAGVLLRAVHDQDDTVASSAAKGLEALGEPRVIPRLADALGAASSEGRVGVVRDIEHALVALAGDGQRRSLAQWRAYAPH